MSVGYLPLAVLTTVDLPGAQGVVARFAVDATGGVLEADGVGEFSMDFSLHELELDVCLSL